MKNLKLITILLITCFAFSCKKDKSNNTTNQAELTVYKNIANSNDELMATYYDPNTSSTSYIYGSTNSEGRGTIAKSMVYEKKGNDTLINVILDADLRPHFLYVSTRSGVKINQLFKFEYVSGDSIKVSFYKYNWLDGTDSLMAQYVTKDNNGRVLYGARVNGTNDNYIQQFAAVVAAIVFMAGPVPIAAGLIVGFALEGGIVGGALTTLSLALVSWLNTANGATLSNNLPPYPTSPTSVQIPNPIGTPSNPTGIPGPGTGTGTYTRNGYSGVMDVTCTLSGTESINIYFEPLGSIYIIPRKNGTYTLNQPGIYPIYAANLDYQCGEPSLATVTISGNSFSMSWVVPNNGDIHCPNEGYNWQYKGTWQ